MRETERSDREVVEEQFAEKPDRLVRLLRFAIALVMVSLLTVVLYALVVGVFSPPAPRTLVESSLLESQAAVTKDPGSGAAWASLAGAQYSGGDTDAAWATLAQARKSVKDRTILLVNSRELEFLLIEGKDAEVLKRVDAYLKTEADFQIKAIQENAAKGIKVPLPVQDNGNQVRLLVFKATAEGNTGKWKDVIKTLDMAVQLDDKAADVLKMRGIAKLRTGDKAGAAKDFQTALKFLPGDAEATKGLEEARGTGK